MLGSKESICKCKRHGSGKSPHAAEQLNPCHKYQACALEPRNCNCWAHMPWNLCSAAKEATEMRNP